jgi:hypothetical protein
MIIKSRYKTRPVRDIGIINHESWIIKVYSISAKHTMVPNELVDLAQGQLSEWLKMGNEHSNYKIAILIIHEGVDGIFTLLNWWIDENTIQNQVFFSSYDEPGVYKGLSEKGIVACVWELAVLWHERNAWIKHVLKKNDQPDWEGYVNDFLNADV